MLIFLGIYQGRPGPKGDPGDSGLPGLRVSVSFSFTHLIFVLQYTLGSKVPFINLKVFFF